MFWHSLPTFAFFFVPENNANMDKMIAHFPDQLGEALQIAEKITLSKHSAPIKNVIITGLGGSGIGGTYVQEFVRPFCKLPVSVVKGYQTPLWANKHTLAICSSYSGNTEETLQAFEQLYAAGAKIVCIASGGKLIESARKYGLDHVVLPGGWSSPRACLGYSFTSQLGVLRAARLIPAKLLAQVKNGQKLLEKENGDIQKRARKIAELTYTKTPVLYCADNTEPVAVRWRQQINENAKMLCWHHVLPEMNHNELVGWRDQRPDLAVIWLRNRDDYNRTTVRMNITKEVTEHFTGTSIEVWSKGKSQIEKAIYLTHLGDWLSYHLAELRQVDPVEIRVIDYLKGELSKI
jgi:glucose/mannose-6-phosphate isomerase